MPATNGRRVLFLCNAMERWSVTESEKSPERETSPALAAAACELTDEALEAIAAMGSAVHGTGHPPMC